MWWYVRLIRFGCLAEWLPGLIGFAWWARFRRLAAVNWEKNEYLGGENQLTDCMKKSLKYLNGIQTRADINNNITDDHTDVTLLRSGVCGLCVSDFFLPAICLSYPPHKFLFIYPLSIRYPNIFSFWISAAISLTHWFWCHLDGRDQNGILCVFNSIRFFLFVEISLEA